MLRSCWFHRLTLMTCLFLFGASTTYAVTPCTETYPDPFVLGDGVATTMPLVDLVADGALLFGLDEDGYLYAFDALDPLTPVLLSRTLVDVQARRIEPDEGWIYVAAGAAGVHAVDVGDPALPVVHAGVIDDIDAFDVACREGHVFVSPSDDGDLRWYDCADPTAPAAADSISLSAATGGSAGGTFRALCSAPGGIYALGYAPQYLADECFVIRLAVATAGDVLQVAPAGRYTDDDLHSRESPWMVFAEGADLAAADGGVHLVLPVHQLDYDMMGDEIVWMENEWTVVRTLDELEPTGLALQGQMELVSPADDGWRQEARITRPSADVLAIALSDRVMLYAYAPGGSTAATHTMHVETRTLHHADDVLTMGDLHDAMLEPYDVTGAGTQPILDHVALNTDLLAETRWYAADDWSKGILATFYHEDSDYGPDYYNWDFRVAAEDGSLCCTGGLSPAPDLYFFTDQYAYFGPSFDYGVDPMLRNWRTGETLYQESWDLGDSRNVFEGGLVYHDDTGGIGIYDFTVYPRPLLGTVPEPGGSVFTMWRIRDGYLLVSCEQGESTLLIYDVSDPTAPALVFESGSLGPERPYEMSINGDILELAPDIGPTTWFDIGDPSAPFQVSGDPYPGVVYGDVALDVQQTDVQIYRILSTTEFEPIGVYRHDHEITMARRWANSLMILDASNVTSVIDACPLDATAVTDPPPAAGDRNSGLQLLGTFPNPFNPQIRLAFSVERAQRLRVDVIDLSGRLVKRLDDRPYDIGAYETTWDGCTDAGAAAASGPYILRVQGDAMTLAAKVLLLK